MFWSVGVGTRFANEDERQAPRDTTVVFLLSVENKCIATTFAAADSLTFFAVLAFLPFSRRRRFLLRRNGWRQRFPQRFKHSIQGGLSVNVQQSIPLRNLECPRVKEEIMRVALKLVVPREHRQRYIAVRQDTQRLGTHP